MEYVLKVRETQEWTVWYIVKADSGDEAMIKFQNGNIGYVIDSEFEENSNYDIIDVEPL